MLFRSDAIRALALKSLGCDAEAVEHVRRAIEAEHGHDAVSRVLCAWIASRVLPSPEDSRGQLNHALGLARQLGLRPLEALCAIDSHDEARAGRAQRSELGMGGDWLD